MKAFRILFALIFWSWNALFLVLVTAGLAPMVMLDLIADAMAGLARWHTVAWAAVLFFLPVVVTVCAALRLRNDARALFVAFFGVEIPAMTLALFRLFGMADLHGSAGVTLASVVGGGFALLAWLTHSASDGTRDGRMHPVARVLVHAGLAVFTVGSLYLGFVLAFITLPLFAEILVDVLKSFVRSPEIVVVGFFPALWAFLTVASVFLAPVFTPVAAVRALVRSHRALIDETPFVGTRTRSRLHVRAAFAMTIVPASLLVMVIASGWQQPHKDVFARLASPPATDDERRAILDDERDIRAALTDAYLAQHRYVADNGKDTLRHAWPRDAPPSEALSDFHRAIARPFVFDGDTSTARTRADELYAALFGEEIERSERDALRAALASNALRDERYAGFMNEGEERVWLAAQRVSVTPSADGAWASVEIADTWMNQTGRDEEVLLMFSLPPDAAITGLWLGGDPDKSKAFTHVVAPRGAAQQVYNEQVRQRRDPALLEQVGPQQYRLRVFPVPPRQRVSGRFLGPAHAAWHDLDVARPRMHVWLRYEVLVEESGRVPYPLLAERRNGFWDSQTTRTFDGPPPEARDDTGDTWVQAPVVVLDTSASNKTLRASIDDACWQLAPAAPLPPRPLEGRIVDVVVDRSYGMRNHKAAMAAAVRALGDAGAQLRFIRTSSAFRGEPPSQDYEDTLDIDAIVPFGATSPREMIEQRARVHHRRFHAREADEAYPRAAVVVLAATGSFDIAQDLPTGINADGPHYLVHFGGLPKGYDDGTADFLATSGGTAVDAKDFDDVIRAIHATPFIARSQAPDAGDVVLGRGDAPLVVAGRELTRAAPGAGEANPTAPACESGPRGVIARLAVRALDRGRLKSDATTLDAMHALAVRASVVTPYSSMIVLVDEEQRRRLAELRKQDDRFQREVEQHKESGAPEIFGAPEPHEWALLALVVAIFAVLARRERSQHSARGFAPS